MWKVCNNSSHQSWHATKDKFHDLPTYPTINRALVVPNVIVVHNKKKGFSIEGNIDTKILIPYDFAKYFK
jgi:hypothetical protein